MSEIDYIQIIIQGGAVGMAVFALWTLYKIVSNHMNHNTQATQDLTIAITKLIDFLEAKGR